MRNENPFNFHLHTNETVKQLLTSLNASRQRVRLYFGDIKTGKCWNEEHDIIGTIGKSTGIKPAPLLINNSRSLGGPAILDHCIVGIQDVETKRYLYRHENLDLGKWDVREHSIHEYPFAAYCNDELHARFKTLQQAERYVKFMRGERMAK